MTNNATTLTQKAGRLKRFAEYPPRDDMQNWRYIYDPGLLHSLGIHLRKTFPHSTVMCEVPLARSLSRRDSVRIPDMSVMLDGDRALMEEQSGYEIETHGKPPDFALEVASPTTGIVDYTAKRLDYERFGVLEYWRFDPSGGRFHDAPLAADRLVNGEYTPIEIIVETDGRRWGLSEVLELELWWDESMLRFRDPATGEFLRTSHEIYADYQASEFRAAQAEARADEERVAKEAAEARLAEMEAELRRLRGE
ncbi:MAG: Uma2 family endonuclease [Chloroflexota bacterium]|nr:Uma2 family endonuclease [Chloroflexota bacterium]